VAAILAEAPNARNTRLAMWIMLGLPPLPSAKYVAHLPACGGLRLFAARPCAALAAMPEHTVKVL
jgi:hypothetical protein